MPTPQTGFAPQSFQVGPEAEFITRPNVDKVSVFACDFVRVLVFLDRLVAAGPLTDSADGLLVNTLEDILSREARADDGQHELLTPIEGVLPACQARDAAVAVPILTHRPKVWKSAGQVLLLKVGFLLITPDDVPLGITEVSIVLRP